MWDKASEDYLKEHYTTLSISELEDHLGKPRGGILKKAQRLGLTSAETKGQKVSLGKKLYSYNTEFFGTYTLDSCYVAGLLAADGNVRYLSGKYPVLTLNLQERDRDLLEQVKSLLNYTGELLYTKPPKTSTIQGRSVEVQGQYRLQISITQQTMDDLEKNFNITPRKTHTLQPPNLKDTQHILAFVAGLIDGDGTVKVATVRGKYRYLNVGFYGNLEMCNWVRNVFKVYSDKEPPQLVQNKNSGLYYTGINGTFAVRFLEEMYRLDIPHLARKYDYLKEFGKGVQHPEKVHFLDLTQKVPEIIPGKYNLTYQEYLDKKDLVLSMCSPVKERIFARNTRVEVLDAQTYQAFLKDNHLEGKSPATEKLGLYYKDKLVSVAGFMTINGEFTLVRFCSSRNTTVVGGLSKLLAVFKDREIVTFSDYRYSLGDVYAKVGFTPVKTNAKRLYFTDGKLLYNRRGFQKKNQALRFPDNFDYTKTERENAENNGFSQVFLGGTVKWILPTRA